MQNIKCKTQSSVILGTDSGPNSINEKDAGRIRHPQAWPAGFRPNPLIVYVTPKA